MPGSATREGAGPVLPNLGQWARIASKAVSTYHAEQDVTELSVLLSLLGDYVRPSCVLEIGTGQGGTAWAWSQLPSMRQVITVDCQDRVPDQRIFPHYVNVFRIIGDSADPEIIQQVRWHTDIIKPRMVYIDGGHDKRTVMEDIFNYGVLCDNYGVIVLHDTQGYPGRDDFAPGKVFWDIETVHPRLELVSKPGGPCGTGIWWIGAAP